MGSARRAYIAKIHLRGSSAVGFEGFQRFAVHGPRLRRGLIRCGNAATRAFLHSEKGVVPELKRPQTVLQVRRATFQYNVWTETVHWKLFVQATVKFIQRFPA